MKRILLLSFLLIGFIGFSQEYKEYYFGEDFSFYKNALIKIDTTSATNMSGMFYENLNNLNNNGAVLFPEEKYKFNTNINLLKGRIFKVENIIDKKTGKEYTGKHNRYRYPVLIIKDTATSETFYFKYDSKFATTSYGFPFLTQKAMSKEGFCDKIEFSVDDFTNVATFNNPTFENGQITPMILYKIIENSNTKYYLSLRSYGVTVNVMEKGVIILFDDGTKINKPKVEIDVEADKKGFEYRAYFSLTEAEVLSLTVKKIKKFRLYIYDKEVGKALSEKFTYYVKCLMEKK